MEKINPMSSESKSRPSGQEGIINDGNKQPRGDHEFHEKAMLTDQAAEEQDLEAIGRLEADLAERQVQDLEKSLPDSAKRGYRALIKLYPDHPHASWWTEKIKE